MIQSMTAFARSQIQSTAGSIVCECRSINHRYLEMSLRLPEVLHELEAPVRERIRDSIKRGKVECFLRYQPSEASGIELTVNTVLVEKLCQANELIAKTLAHPAQINTMDILRWPGILQMKEMDLESVQKDVMTLLDDTLAKLVEARGREGEQLKGAGEEGRKLTQPTKPTLPDQAKRRIKAFGNSFESAITKLTTANLIKPYDTIVGRQTIDFSSIDMGNRATESFEDALGTIYLIATGASAQQKKTYAQTLNAIWTDNKSVLEKFTEDVAKIYKEAAPSSEKLYAYFGGYDPDNTIDKAIKTRVPKPFNLEKLARVLHEIRESINILARGGTLPQRNQSQPAQQGAEQPQQQKQPAAQQKQKAAEAA